MANVMGAVFGMMEVQVYMSFAQHMPCDILIHSHVGSELLSSTKVSVQNQLLIIFPFGFLGH